jgi:hypothetical protein
MGSYTYVLLFFWLSVAGLFPIWPSQISGISRSISGDLADFGLLGGCKYALVATFFFLYFLLHSLTVSAHCTRGHSTKHEELDAQLGSPPRLIRFPEPSLATKYCPHTQKNMIGVSQLTVELPAQLRLQFRKLKVKFDRKLEPKLGQYSNCETPKSCCGDQTSVGKMPVQRHSVTFTQPRLAVWYARNRFRT